MMIENKDFVLYNKDSVLSTKSVEEKEAWERHVQPVEHN